MFGAEREEPAPVKLSRRRHRPRPPVLGELELAVLEILWRGSAATAQAIHDELAPRDITLTTVQSTLERLTRKALLARTKHGRAYRYRAVVTREALIASLLRALSDELATGRLEPLLGGFVALLEEAGDDAAAARLRAALDGR